MEIFRRLSNSVIYGNLPKTTEFLSMEIFRIRGESSVHPTSNANSKLLSNLRIVVRIRLFYAIESLNIYTPTLMAVAGGVFPASEGL